MPGMSYLFLWPFLFSLMSLGWIFFNKTMDETSRVRILIQTAGILPAIIIFTPTLIVMFHFAPNQLFVVTISLVALVLGLLIPPYINLIKTRRHILTLVAFSASLLFFIIAHFTSGFNEERPRPNGIAYLHNLDTKKALWFSPSSKTDEWTSQFYKDEPEIKYMKDIFPLSMDYYRTIITGNAEEIKLPEPQIEIMEDSLIEENRLIKFKLKSNIDAPIMSVSLKHSSAIQAVRIDNHLVENYKCTKDESLELTYMAVPENGFVIELEMVPKGEIEAVIAAQSRSLPAELEHNFRPRFNDMIPLPNFDYSTILIKTIEF